MTDQAAILAAILAEPKEDTPRLAYADWLDEHDQHERAEFIRCQIQLARWDCQQFPGSWQHNCRYPNKGEFPCHALRRREQELLSNSLGLWFAWPGCPPIASLTVSRQNTHPKILDAIYTRGFVSAITCDWQSWRTHADAILRAQPIERVRLTDWPDGADSILNDANGWRLSLKKEWPGIEWQLPTDDGPASDDEARRRILTGRRR